MKENTGIRAHKRKQVMEYLLNQLLPLPYGSRLPGIRTIMAQTGAGRLTVDHVLRELARQRLIRVEPDRGTFRIKPEGKNDEIRLLHWSWIDWEQIKFVAPLFDTLKALAQADGRRLAIENVRRRSWETIGEELTGQGVSRVILYSPVIPDYAEYLAKRMEVCLELLPRHMERVVTELRGSPEMTGLQLNYLFNLGYRRIGYIHYGLQSISQYPVQVMRLLDYYRFMAEHHLYVDPDWVLHLQDRCRDLGAGLDRMMAADLLPEALIVPGSAWNPLYSWCRKHGIRLGKDLAVFCCDDLGTVSGPEATTVTNNPVEIAETFWKMFLAAERGEKVESRYTNLRIRTGQTVRPRK